MVSPFKSPLLLLSLERCFIYFVLFIYQKGDLTDFVNCFPSYRALALSLFSGNCETGFEHNETYAAFMISVTLTDQGFDNVEEVTYLIVFSPVVDNDKIVWLLWTRFSNSFI